MARRVVISGIGAVSGLGVGALPLWDALCAGRSGLRPITRFDPGGFKSRLGAGLDNFSARDYVPKHYRKAVKVMARDVELAVAAAKEAVEDAGLITRAALDIEADPAAAEKTTIPAARLGCHIGAGLISADADELAAAMTTARAFGPSGAFDIVKWGASGMENLTPLWMLKYLPNMVSCHVTIIHGACGPSNTITCAEASGLLSIGESLRVIERGDADLCFSGGAESKLNLMGLMRMEFTGRLADTTKFPGVTDGSAIVKPFDASSPGALLGEGAGIVLLEAHESATKRGAKIYAELVGFGGAHSPPRPNYPGQSGAPRDFDYSTPDEGFQFAIENALQDAGLAPGDIDAAVVLGSGSPAMDLGEAGALAAVFGAGVRDLPLVTIGPNIGNCMAAVGGLMACVGALVMREQRLPARLNAGTPVLGLRAGAASQVAADIEHLLVATSSLGGQNAALVLKRV
ncbi:beta-ketoacyl-ACP synthase II [soil metagenome]